MNDEKLNIMIKTSNWDKSKLKGFVRPTCRALIGVIALAQIAGGQPPNSNGTSAPKISIKLSVEKKHFAKGESIPLRIDVVNSGTDPVLIGNFISESRGVPSPVIDFELKNSQGEEISPDVVIISDSFSPRKPPNATVAFLTSYLLLYPGYGLTTQAVIDETLFKALRIAGDYRLSVTYSSNGLMYPPTYRQLGLSDDDVKSMPFPAWRGKLSSNEVRFTVDSAAPKSH
jgi:hypothetical protein